MVVWGATVQLPGQFNQSKYLESKYLVLKVEGITDDHTVLIQSFSCAGS
jgi:hypothetical protein